MSENKDGSHAEFDFSFTLAESSMLSEDSVSYNLRVFCFGLYKIRQYYIKADSLMENLDLRMTFISFAA